MIASDEPHAIDDIVLIGPTGVGKTTVAAALSERLGLPVVSMDDVRDGYYAELGYDPAVARTLFDKDGPASVWSYCKAFDPHSVERFLADNERCILDMGGGSTVHEHADNLARVKRALSPYRNIVLLLPHEDRHASLDFLNKRTGWKHTGRNINRILLAHRSNYELCTLTVYTADRTPAAIAGEIIRRTR